MEFTHFDEQGNALMVDVGDKADTKREAVAKGAGLGVARVAGIMGAKRTSDLIPLCHILNLTKLSIDFTVIEETNEIQAACTARTTGRTGVEMEALTGVTVALLTIYDMCKAVDKTMELGNIYLEHKSGGKSGEFHNPRK